MGILCWIFYIVLGVIFFGIILLLDTKYTLSKVQSFIFSILLLMITSGICLRFGISYSDNIFLSFVFLMVVDIIYSSYFQEMDFFDKDDGKLIYYILLIIIGFIINQEFINEVSSVFLTGEDLRLILWSLVLVFLYVFFKEKEKDRDKNKKYNMSINRILNSYTKYKYLFGEDCESINRDVSNMLYSIMIYEASRKSGIARSFDNFKFKINSKPCRMGIMQVLSKKFISDSESIEIVKKRLEKLYKDKKNNKDINMIFDEYFEYDNSSCKYIFEIIKKF